jgi:leucyl-tRNA synthetase
MWAPWPEAGPVDEKLIQSAQYLTEAAHEFRLRKKAALNPGKGKKVVSIPTHAVIWVAKTYPPWQNTVLTTMKKLYESNNNSFPDNKVIAHEFKDKAELKKYMKKLMPFVQVVKENVEKQGLKAMALTSDIDEMEILNTSLPYLVNTLEMEGIEVKSSDTADDKVKEDCCPGQPFISFKTEPSVKMTLINNQPFNSLFEIQCDIFEGDSVSQLASRIAKMERSKVKDVSSLKLLRFVDPESGWRKIPDMNSPTEGKTEVKADAVFHINQEAGTVTLSESNSAISIGPKLVYMLS